MIAGVDEAGRGSVLGPLAIAGIALKKEDLPKLKDMGVKDSKMLSAKKREELAVELKQLAQQYHVVLLRPAEIDVVVNSKIKLHKLNRLEAIKMAKILSILKPETAYVDASDINAHRFGEYIAENLDFELEIVSEHKADITYPIVSAASIIAKVERDKAIAKLKTKHGEIGCGYPSDQKTVNFLKQCIKNGGIYPDCVRKSWKTAKRIKNQEDASQQKLM